MFDRCLYFNTSALARRLECEWSAAFKPFDLTPPQAFMLRVVLDHDMLLQREIADKLHISRPTATRALDTLEAKGFIVRKASKHDGRECSIHPTAKALAIKAQLTQASAKVTNRLKKILSDDEFNETVEKIKMVRTALE
jgi:DNA-binding MarR family transcriptional regulator